MAANVSVFNRCQLSVYSRSNQGFLCNVPICACYFERCAFQTNLLFGETRREISVMTIRHAMSGASRWVWGNAMTESTVQSRMQFRVNTAHDSVQSLHGLGSLPLQLQEDKKKNTVLRHMVFSCIFVLVSKHAVSMGRYSSTTLWCDIVRQKKNSLFTILIQLFVHIKELYIPVYSRFHFLVRTLSSCLDVVTNKV